MKDATRITLQVRILEKQELDEKLALFIKIPNRMHFGISHTFPMNSCHEDDPLSARVHFYI